MSHLNNALPFSPLTDATIVAAAINRQALDAAAYGRGQADIQSRAAFDLEQAAMQRVTGNRWWRHVPRVDLVDVGDLP